MNFRRTIVALVISGLVSLPPAQLSAQPAHPAGVPNLSDSAVLKQFVPVGQSPLAGDPDFPVVLLANRSERDPQLLLVVLDARNGKATWSFGEDAAVFYLVFSDPATLQQAFLDEGFAARGEPSGEFLAAGPDAAEELMARLREGYLLCRGLARLGPSA